MARKKSFDDFDRPLRKDDPLREVRQALARLRLDTEKILRGARTELDATFHAHRSEMEKLLRGKLGVTDPPSPPKPPLPKRPWPPRRKPPKGGSEAVTVEPNRPNLGEGGAAAALEFDE